MLIARVVDAGPIDVDLDVGSGHLHRSGRLIEN